MYIRINHVQHRDNQHQYAAKLAIGGQALLKGNANARDRVHVLEGNDRMPRRKRPP